MSDFQDLPVERVFLNRDIPDPLYPTLFEPEHCIDSDILTMCKSRIDESSSTQPSAIKLELKDSFDYQIRGVTIWRPFESEFYSEDLSQQKGQRFEVENYHLM